MSDPTAAYHGGNPFSEAAHASVDKRAMSAKVLAIIAAAGERGMTSDEVEQVTGLPHQSISARMVELKQRNEILPAGRRPTRSGRSAGVYVAVPVQQALWSA